MQRRPELERKVIRGIALAIMLVAAAYVVLALLPAHESFLVDTSGCTVDVSQRPHHDCTVTRTLVSTENGLDRYFLIALAVLVAPGLLVLWKPRPATAGLWSPLALVGTMTIVYAVWESNTGFESSTYEWRDLWTVPVCMTLLEVLYLVILVVLPVASCIYAWLTRNRLPEPPEFPAARIVR